MKYTKPVVANTGITPFDASCTGPNMFGCKSHTCRGSWVCSTYWDAKKCTSYKMA